MASIVGNLVAPNLVEDQCVKASVTKVGREKRSARTRPATQPSATFSLEPQQPPTRSSFQFSHSTPQASGPPLNHRQLHPDPIADYRQTAFSLSAFPLVFLETDMVHGDHICFRSWESPGAETILSTRNIQVVRPRGKTHLNAWKMGFYPFVSNEFIHPSAITAAYLEQIPGHNVHSESTARFSRECLSFLLIGPGSSPPLMPFIQGPSFRSMTGFLGQYSNAEQCSQCSAMQFNAMQCTGMQLSALQCKANARVSGLVLNCTPALHCTDWPD
ncbi:hypothetical protein DFH06DRAFT_1148813 [Mycena polygramma]|nr:hypothetical protein DFH06DRAFT_1148813 [Mycena polygramma]